jgi:hypothetical protein
MSRIDIIAGNKNSIAEIIISGSGDVHLVPRFSGSKNHFSRHADGTRHMRVFDDKESLIESCEMRRGPPISELRGIECLPSQKFCLESVDVPYKPKEKPAGIFSLNIPDEVKSVSLNSFIFTEDSKEKVGEICKKYMGLGSYMYVKSSPMIALVVSEEL